MEKVNIVMYNDEEVFYCESIDEMAEYLIEGYQVYGYTESEDVAIDLIYECNEILGWL